MKLQLTQFTRQQLGNERFDDSFVEPPAGDAGTDAAPSAGDDEAFAEGDDDEDDFGFGGFDD